MLQLLYNNEPLDISQDDNAELQQSSPLFAIEKSIAEFSTPITILYSDRNCRLLNHYFLELTTKKKISLPVSISEQNSYTGRGTLVIENSNINQYLSGEASLTGYVLINVSSFFNLIQNVKLNTLKMGGLRQMQFTTFDVTDGTNGYWQKFQDTLDFTDDYIVIPVQNNNIQPVDDSLIYVTSFDVYPFAYNPDTQKFDHVGFIITVDNAVKSDTTFIFSYTAYFNGDPPLPPITISDTITITAGNSSASKSNGLAGDTVGRGCISSVDNQSVILGNYSCVNFAQRVTISTMNSYASGKLSTLVTTVFPFIKLKFILDSIAAEFGWQFDYTGINDTAWQRLICYPYSGIDVADFEYPGIYLSVVPFTQIQFSLNEFMDPTVDCSSFILQICTRYGWAPIVDNNKKTIRFVALKENKNFTRKDFTKYAQPEGSEDYKDDPPVYSYKNEFTGSDSFNSDEDISSYAKGEQIDTKFELPTPDEKYDNVVIFCEAENQYYIQVVPDGSTERVWQPFRDNIYDDVVENSTAHIDTKVTTMATYWYNYETRDGVAFYALIPYAEQNRFEAPGIRTIFYLGMAQERKEDGSFGDYDYPFAAAINFLSDSTTALLDWANVFKYERNGVEYGIENYWYNSWITLVQNGTVFMRAFNLPMHELLNLKWDEKIVVNNIEYLIQQIYRPFPYEEKVQLVLKRISSISAQLLTKQRIYVRLEQNITATDQDITLSLPYYTYHYNNATQGNVFVRTYADAAGTIPLTVSGLIIKYRRTKVHDSDSFAIVTQSVFSGVQTDLNYDSILQLLEYDFSRTYADDSSIGTDSQAGHYTVSFDLIPDAAYTII